MEVPSCNPGEDSCQTGAGEGARPRAGTGKKHEMGEVGEQGWGLSFLSPFIHFSTLFFFPFNFSFLLMLGQ